MGKFAKRNNIIIEEISLDKNRLICKLRISESLNRLFTSDMLFMEYDEDLSSVPLSILACPFIGTLLAFSWITDSVLWVKDIDRTYYESLTRVKQGYQDIYCEFDLKGRLVPSIITQNSVSESNPNNQSLILFSGGADCQASLIRNLNKHPILCNIQGWYKSVDSFDPVAYADRCDISNFAKEIDLPFRFVKSNFATIINLNEFDKTYKSKLGDSLWHGFLHSMAFISIAIPLAFNHNIPEIIIASSLTTGLNFLCASNTTTDAEFKYAKDGLILHDGFELNRQNKIKVITDFQKQIGKPFFMRVCSFHEANCCHCEKCFRTILGIVAENSNPRDFGFNMSKTLTEHWNQALNEHIALMSFTSEKLLHWPHIIERMKDNYNEMDKEKKDFVDWFLNYDFVKHKKVALRKYYRNNFFSIIKRKLRKFYD